MDASTVKSIERDAIGALQRDASTVHRGDRGRGASTVHSIEGDAIGGAALQHRSVHSIEAAS